MMPQQPNLREITYRPPMTQRTTKVGTNRPKIFKYISDGLYRVAATVYLQNSFRCEHTR